jgi:beta-ureidopropionase / N-carbamoyl-L-amino-acid hydrolase
MTFTPDARINLDCLLADIDRSVGVGREDGLPPVLVGRYLDTQANGGRFAGILGVLGALEVVCVLNDLGHVTRRPIEIVNWTNEEGARFSPPMLASGCFAGEYALEWAHERPAEDGATFGGELKRIGYRGSAPAGGRVPDAYFELHIEQGPVLDAEKMQVGVVTHAYRSHGFLVEFHGETAHTRPWPIERRHNALVAAARLLVGVDDIGWEFASSGGKATAARLVALPNKTGILRCVAMALPTTMRNTPLQKISSPAPTSCCMLSSSARTAETGPLADQRIIQKRRGDHELQVHCSSRSDGPAG